MGTSYFEHLMVKCCGQFLELFFKDFVEINYLNEVNFYNLNPTPFYC